MAAAHDLRFAARVRRGLGRPGQKELPSGWLYDELGSALYEAITALPEYGLTRAGARLMRAHARDIARLAAPGMAVAELGSGSGRNTRILLDVLARRGRPLSYWPIDSSASALEACRRGLADRPRVRFRGLALDWLEGLEVIGRLRRKGAPLLVLFLGSTIGNFPRPEALRFLERVRQALHPGDLVLVGTDLEQRRARLQLAYDDPLGVTAAFNKNMLSRINRELGASFDLGAFGHQARWVEGERRIEMHLVSKRRQRVAIPGARLEVGFARGESIWTESCHKFTAEEALALGTRADLRVEAQWLDREWPFAHTLFRVPERRRKARTHQAMPDFDSMAVTACPRRRRPSRARSRR